MATEQPIMAPITASVAGRYASALFELAEQQGLVRDVEDDLTRFQALMDESPDLKRLVRSPVFSAEAQEKAIGAVVERAGITGLGSNFLRLIARNRRLFAAPDMIRAYRSLAAQARGEIEAEVTSAVPLSEAQLDSLKDNLQAASGGKQIQLVSKVDPALLGGLIVKMGSRMVDSSLRSKLSSLKARMKEAH